MLKKRLQTAAGLLALCMVCIWNTGCGHRDNEDLKALEELRLDDSVGFEGGKDAGKEISGESGSFGDTAESGDQKETGFPDAGTKDRIFVHVCGAVQVPGVYELKEGARLFEAVACAGGIREDAAEESVNQARTVTDGERLYIPTEEEVRQGLDEFLMSAAGEDSGTGGAAGLPGDGSSGAAGGMGSGGKVNINTASREELKTLNGIGDTRAGSILAYRESKGLFGSIEDLMKVEGIKEGVFQKLKDDITVN